MSPGATVPVTIAFTKSLTTATPRLAARTRTTLSPKMVCPCEVAVLAGIRVVLRHALILLPGIYVPRRRNGELIGRRAPVLYAPPPLLV